MLLTLAQQRQVLFFGGKGGVGKTTLASATALLAARQGRRVLLVSTDPAHNLGHLWERKVGPTPVPLRDGLDGMEIDPAESLEAHLKQVGGTLRRLMPHHLTSEVDKHLERSRDAPGMHEAALLERLAQTLIDGLRQYDLLVFDTAPSGHTARLMALPEMMTVWTEGMLRQQARSDTLTRALQGAGADNQMGARIIGESGKSVSVAQRDDTIRTLLNQRRERFTVLRDVVADSQRAGFVIVLAAERLPVMETIEFEAQLRRAGVPVAGLVVNKRTPAQAGEFFAERHEQEARYMTQLHEALPSLPVQEVVLQRLEVVGETGLSALAEQLSTGL